MNIKKYRTELKMTVRDLADKANLSVGYISDLENGKVDNPSKAVMTTISNALGKTVPEVFFDSKED